LGMRLGFCRVFDMAIIMLVLMQLGGGIPL
jgi:hypothetical protein